MPSSRLFTCPACPVSRAERVRDGRATPHRAISGWLILACAMAIPASAQRALPPSSIAGDTVVLTLADVQRLTLVRNPASLAEREDIAIANAGLRRARTVPFNPDVSVQRTGSGGTTEAVATQEVEVLGQRGLRVNAARIGVGRATALVSNAARLVVAEASIVFARVVAAERRVTVTREGLELVERLVGAVRIQLREGEISALEANLAEIELGRARARVLAGQRIANTLLLDLKRLVGLSPDVPVRLAPDVAAATPSPGFPRVLLDDTLPRAADSLMAMALRSRADLAASTSAVREFEALASLARREALPNIRLGAVVERESGTQRIGPVIGVSIPVFNRNQGLIAEREAQRRQATLRRNATELRVRTDVIAAVRAYRTASDEATVFEQSVQQPSRENAALLELAYRAGKIPLPTFLLLRNQLLEGELGYWDAWLARQEALVQLQAATGTLPTFDTDSSRTGTSVGNPR